VDDAIISHREEERDHEIERKEPHDPPTEILSVRILKMWREATWAGNNQYAGAVVEVTYASSVGEGYWASAAHKSEYSRQKIFVCHVRNTHLPKYFERIGASTAAGTPSTKSAQIAHTNPPVLSMAGAIPMTGMCIESS